MNSLNKQGKLVCSWRVISFCFTSGTCCRVAFVSNSVKSHEWGKNRVVITKNGSCPLSLWPFNMSNYPPIVPCLTFLLSERSNINTNVLIKRQSKKYTCKGEVYWFSVSYIKWHKYRSRFPAILILCNRPLFLSSVIRW